VNIWLPFTYPTFITSWSLMLQLLTSLDWSLALPLPRGLQL
jgi:hypothetical protein